MPGETVIKFTRESSIRTPPATQEFIIPCHEWETIKSHVKRITAPHDWLQTFAGVFLGAGLALFVDWLLALPAPHLPTPINGLVPADQVNTAMRTQHQSDLKIVLAGASFLIGGCLVYFSWAFRQINAVQAEHVVEMMVRVETNAGGSSVTTAPVSIENGSVTATAVDATVTIVQ